MSRASTIPGNSRTPQMNATRSSNRVAVANSLTLMLIASAVNGSWRSDAQISSLSAGRMSAARSAAWAKVAGM